MPLFVLIMVSLGGYFYAYPAYQLHQAENKVRESIKNIPNNSRTQNLEYLDGHVAKAEMLNQYPNFLIYIQLENYKDRIATTGIQDFIRDFSCEGINRLKSSEELNRKATLNVMKNDQHKFEYIVKNSFGYEIFKYQQNMQNCPNFAELEAYITPK